MARAQMKFVVVAIDYFTKSIEVSPLAKISKEKMCDFVWKLIFCRFGIPKSIVTDNALQFNNSKLDEMCSQLSIHKTNSAPITRS